MKFSLSEKQWNYISRLGYPGDKKLKAFAAEAIYRGGEKIVELKLTGQQYLPYNLEEIIEVGINTLSTNILTLLTPTEIESKINSALLKKQGLSIIRLGDGEVIALSHDKLITSDEIRKNKRLTFALGGFKVPNYDKRDLLVTNLLEADIVGIPNARYPTYQRLFNQIAKIYNLPLNHMNLTSSQINYQLNDNTTIVHHILANYKVLLIGNRSNEGKRFLNDKYGYTSIVGTIL